MHFFAHRSGLPSQPHVKPHVSSLAKAADLSHRDRLFKLRLLQLILIVIIDPDLLLPSRVLVKVFPVSTAEPAERFTRLTTTDVHAHQTTPAETVRRVSHFSNYVEVFFLSFLRANPSK